MTNNTNNKLEPCPRCGSNNIMQITTPLANENIIKCNGHFARGCGLRLSSASIDGDLVEAWNTRAKPDNI